MIIHRYIPFDDSEDPLDPHDLIAKIGDLMMRYQVDLEEALRLMLAGGQIPNLYLKEAGISDFIEDLIQDLEEQKKEILERYDPGKNKPEINRNIASLTDELKKSLKNDSLTDLLSGEDTSIPDFIYQLRWTLLQSPKKKENRYLKSMDELLNLMETKRNLERALKDFDFLGKDKIKKEAINETLKKLFSIEDTINALKEALSSGDLQSLDLNKLRAAMGAEKVEEFLELQQKLLEQIKEILDKEGLVEMDYENPENSKISSHAIDYISSRALSEFYEGLKNDQGGMNRTELGAEGEQVTSQLKSFEFGDAFSNIDWPASLVNALVKNRSKPALQDLETYIPRGAAKNAMIILLDMSGSMYRFERFYYAKKMILALDKLMKKEYPNDRLEIIGFGSLAKKYNLNDLFLLQPHPVTFSDPLIRLKIDLSRREDQSEADIPLYFTNLQRGLSLARRLLGSKETKNRQIILITDGVPTAHMEGSVLHLNYPPSGSDFESALQEARMCREEGIIINTFLLSSEWWESFSADFGKKTFAQKFVQTSGGRFFQTHPHELGVTVLYNYISGQKKYYRWGDRGGNRG